MLKPCINMENNTIQYVLTMNKLLPSILFVSESAKAIEIPPLKPPHVNTERFKPFLDSFLLKRKNAGSNEMYLAVNATTIKMQPINR